MDNPFEIPFDCSFTLSFPLYHHAPSPQKCVRIYTFLLLLPSHLQYSLDALEVYIQSQKVLLTCTQSDVDCLRLLCEQAAADPEIFFDDFDDKVFTLLSSTHFIYSHTGNQHTAP
jgi:hypothetical protein